MEMESVKMMFEKKEKYGDLGIRIGLGRDMNSCWMPKRIQLVMDLKKLLKLHPVARLFLTIKNGCRARLWHPMGRLIDITGRDFVFLDQHIQNIVHEIKKFVSALAMSGNDGVLWKRSVIELRRDISSEVHRLIRFWTYTGLARPGTPRSGTYSASSPSFAGSASSVPHSQPVEPPSGSPTKICDHPCPSRMLSRPGLIIMRPVN
ncbi:hypothetical protein F2Q69_00023739 [Brassica cretica]|uniref:Uncharacterized protein n=1 Tax=Brassica cretica TaxID=69181 RepID=A0A8S9Q2F8_BRACR|nr:hypothetical protein F2Q69_00023739 [Brassica cretica]